MAATASVRGFLLVGLLAGLLLGPGGPEAARAAPRGEGPWLTVLGARVDPVKADGQPWDASHGALPGFLYRPLAGLAGFPPLLVLGLIPYRNRPDPRLAVRMGDRVLARSDAVQGSFAPAWALSFALPPPDERGPKIRFEVTDEDLEADDPIGAVEAEVGDLLATPGLHVLEGTRGLFDLSVVVHDRTAGGEPLRVRVESLRAEARERRPLGGDWDAGGNPLRRRFPRLPLPRELEGMAAVRPDLEVTLVWSDGREKASPVGKDDLVLEWTAVGWEVEGRPGAGDGFLVRVVDRDVVFHDPVGIVWIPLEDLLAARQEGLVEVRPDDIDGVARLEVRFSVR